MMDQTTVMMMDDDDDDTDSDTGTVEAEEDAASILMSIPFILLYRCSRGFA
jgi:hypothetical protein